MSKQLSHELTDFEQRRFPLVLICDGVASPANVGSLFRLADAFNIEKLILCGAEIDLRSPRIRKTARATIQKVDFEQQEDVLQVCHHYKQQEYQLLALEITDDSRALETIDFGKMRKIALVVGNEIFGLTEEILKISDKVLHITMFGRNSSMNVAQSAGIALYEITKSLPSYQ